MRKITSEAVDAFYARCRLNKQNTKVFRGLGGEIYLELHGNAIAKLDENGLKITLAGWNTNTTRERLNGLHGVKVTTKQGQAYLNGSKWGGEWTKIN